MNKKEWRVEGGGDQRLYKLWRNKPDDSDFLNTFPYKLSVGVDSYGASLSAYCSGPVGGQIIVTKSYDDMFHRLLRLRMDRMGRAQGAVITGQPGIGASL